MDNESNLISSPPFAKCKPSPPIGASPQPDSSDIERFICAVANNTWRLCRKIDNHSEAKSWMRPVTGLVDALSAMGVHIKDHTAEPYDTGMAVNVVAWERRPETEKEIIIETIKPSIRWNGKLLQWGDVIVCSPDEESNTEAMEGLQQ